LVYLHQLNLSCNRCCPHRLTKQSRKGELTERRDHLEFTFWYLISKNLVKRGDSSRLVITADGVDYLEQHFETNLQRKRLKEASGAT
jgi:hypothetical protein